MRGARSVVMVVSISLLALSACTTIAPAVETAPPSTGAPSLVLPTIGPEETQTPAATQTAEPTQPPEPDDQPNLVVSEFVVDEDPVLVGTTSTLTATVKNVGSGDAGPFAVEIVVTRADQSELVLESKTVEGGLAAGDSTQLTTTISPIEAGGLNLLARADVRDSVIEEDESDNVRVLEIVVQSLGNLTFLPDGFTVTPSDQAPRYTFDYSLTNTGSSNVTGPFRIRFFGYTDAGNIVEWGYMDDDMNLAPGDLYRRLLDFPIDPGTYRAYALADSLETLAETDEGDNEAFYDFTAP